MTPIALLEPKMARSPASNPAMAVLTLRGLPGIGPARARDVVALVKNGELGDLREAIRRALPKLRPATATELDTARAEAEQMLVRCQNLGIQVVSVLDPAYPARLRQIPDYPPVLYVLGDLATLSIPSVSVVGKQQASPYGLRIARQIGQYLADNGHAVVSGHASGIDVVAHDGALAGQGRTIAVYPCGLDHALPLQKLSLTLRIVEGGGVLVSEHPPGQAVRKEEFPKRLRIQSGLSIFSIIVESGIDGDGIEHAGYAQEQERTVFAAFPGPEAEGFDSTGSGYLIAIGARPLGGMTGLQQALALARGALRRGTPDLPEPEMERYRAEEIGRARAAQGRGERACPRFPYKTWGVRIRWLIEADASELREDRDENAAS